MTSSSSQNDFYQYMMTRFQLETYNHIEP